MQPTYIPWLGYFDMIDKVDVFVFLDDVQLERRSWQVRNRIKGAIGEIWLTIPVKKTKIRDDLTINNAQINNDESWKNKHLKTIKLNYGKGPFFSEIYDFLNKEYRNVESLADFNIKVIKDISTKIGITTTFLRSSEIKEVKGSKDQRLFNICNAIGACSYLSPKGSKQYLNKHNKGGVFAESNVGLYYHSYEHPEYTQLYGSFVPYMGVYDLLFNVGFG
jgi:hypothetical protein